MQNLANSEPTGTLPSLGFANPKHRRAEHIATDIRTMIMSNTLTIGQKLPTETALCLQYNVSRTTLREAIQMLRSMGMLDVTPGRGSYVRAPSLSTLLPSLQLLGRGPGFNTADAYTLLLSVVAQSIAAAQQQLGRLQEASTLLQNHTLIPNSLPARCMATEAAWYQGLLQISGHTLFSFIGQILLPMLHESRLTHYQNGGPDALMRTLQLQLRVNAALSEGDGISAMRILQPVIMPSPTQQAA